ncbi:MAG: HlyC/CorC family transporter [Puniceicoccaceae bacterium]|nr:MAG: HlyC/CorC family transporter [Puniceicoccaceae bacterium]
MVTAFIFAIGFTIGVSALCSILEAMILSTTTAEIEALKKVHPRRGERLEKYKLGLEETSSAILSLNTLANTLGATMVGGLAVQIWPDSSHILLKISTAMALGILFFSEILPKNIGVLYRPTLQPVLIFPLIWVCAVMSPISRVVGWIVRFTLRPSKPVENSDSEIILLAEKSAKEGTLTANERDMINNALSLDELLVNEIMTPRTVVFATDAEETVETLLQKTKDLPFARFPVYEDQLDNITGVVRRRDIYSAQANKKSQLTIKELANEAIFIPDNAAASDALQTFLKTHQQLAIAVDEFGSMSGVIAMEDVIEHIIGQEIFEHDDPAIDMRELARRRRFAEKRKLRREG